MKGRLQQLRNDVARKKTQVDIFFLNILRDVCSYKCCVVIGLTFTEVGSLLVKYLICKLDEFLKSGALIIMIQSMGIHDIIPVCAFKKSYLVC